MTAFMLKAQPAFSTLRQSNCLKLGNGVAHNGLGLPTSMNNQDSSSQTCALTKLMKALFFFQVTRLCQGDSLAIYDMLSLFFLSFLVVMGLNLGHYACKASAVLHSYISIPQIALYLILGIPAGFEKGWLALVHLWLALLSGSSICLSFFHLSALEGGQCTSCCDKTCPVPHLLCLIIHVRVRVGYSRTGVRYRPRKSS